MVEVTFKLKFAEAEHFAYFCVHIKGIEEDEQDQEHREEKSKSITENREDIRLAHWLDKWTFIVLHNLQKIIVQRVWYSWAVSELCIEYIAKKIREAASVCWFQ